MKKIVLIGASGYVGSAILNEALNRGFQVKAAVRNPAKITITNPNLEVVEVDVSSVDKVAEISKGADAVISAYNPGWKNPNIYEELLRNYPAILNGVKKAGVGRFLMVGGASTLYVAPGVRLMDQGVPKSLEGGILSLAKFYTDTLSKERDIDWIFLSPAASLVPGERTGKYRLGKDDLIVDDRGESVISVQDFAKAMIDELETPKHHKERFTLGY